MNRHQGMGAVLVLSLGVGLHLGYSHLANGLAGRFPDLNQPSAEGTAPLADTPFPEQEMSTVSPQEVVVVPRFLMAPELELQPPESAVPGESYHFSIPPDLATAVDFWTRIYAVYDSSRVVFHDSENLAIHSVVDFSALDQLDLSTAEREAIRSRKVAEETVRIQSLLDSEAAQRIRSQTGLRDKFLRAVKISGKYLPHFEEVFQSYGVPAEITRLVFVESLFQEGAYSKVGAAGLWQFMSSTARVHRLRVDRLIDERYDPILASHAAARLLRHNFENLGSWPLAINAYNSGTGQMWKAIQTLGTRDIAQIVNNYRGSTYGFASRNFYCEFLAALVVSQNAERYFGRVERERPLEYDLVTLPVGASFPQLAFLSDASVENLRLLNPAFTPTVFKGAYTLPAGSRIRIPRGKAELFAARFVEFYRPGQMIPTSYAENRVGSENRRAY